MTALQLMKLRREDLLRHERDVIERQVRHVSRLVDDLLDISRITRDKVSLDKQAIEISVAIAKAVEIAEPLIEERGHRLRVDVPASGLVVEADAVRLSQVVANLLTNAARYTPPEGRIDVTARRDGGEVVLDVTDTGNGISAELLPRVFELFVQGARPIDRAQGGLGLGLALVQNLVRMHGGTVSAHSDGPGRGSRFTVRLPASHSVSAVSDEARLPPIAARRVARASAKRILIVDDNTDAAEMLAEMLNLLGHEVSVAYDAPAALKVLERFAPQVAILDIGLPVMDGYELARRIRSAEGVRMPRLIAMTGYGQPEDVERSRAAGFDAHLVKPVSVDRIVAVLDPREPGQSKPS